MRAGRTHSAGLTDVDAESGVPADPRGGQIPGGEFGPYPVLPIRHLFPLEAVSILLLPDETGIAPAPVSVLLLSVLPFSFRRPARIRRG